MMVVVMAVVMVVVMIPALSASTVRVSAQLL